LFYSERNAYLCGIFTPKTVSVKKNNFSEQIIVGKGRLTAMSLAPWGTIYGKGVYSRFVLDPFESLRN